MKRIRISLSRGEFYRANAMRYTTVMLTKDLIVSDGDLLLLENEEYKGDCELDCTLVRKVVDWDCVDFMDFNKSTYQVIVENENYLT